MSTQIPTNCPTREWSNVSEFEDWLRESESTPPARPPENSKNGQKLGFDTYVSFNPKHASATRCLCDSEGGQLPNDILLGGQFFNVPLHWSDNKTTATQIVLGKRKRKVMRSHLLVLCQVEDVKNKWFEVAVLNKDLSYPFSASVIGMSCWPFLNYAEAKRQFQRLLRQDIKRKEVEA